VKKMLIDFKNDDLWKKMIKISFISSFLGMSTFWFFIVILLIDINTDKLFYIIFILITKKVFISYSLSIYIINSNEIQQQKYRYLWLFLFVIATINLFGIISMILLIKQQNKQTNVMIEHPQLKPKVNITKTEEIQPVIVKNEKWLLAWALYSSIGMMIFIVTIPILIINLINIKHNWKKALIDVRTLKKITYFSHDISLILTVKFTV